MRTQDVALSLLYTVTSDKTWTFEPLWLISMMGGGGLGKITLRISPALSKGPHATSHMLLTTRQDRAVISALETVTGDLAPGHEATMSQTRA